MQNPIQETRRLADFLNVELAEEELVEISDKCSFQKLKLANETVKDHSRLLDFSERKGLREFMKKLYRKGEYSLEVSLTYVRFTSNRYTCHSSKLHIWQFILFKGRGQGINSSQSKSFGKIRLSMQLSHLIIIFEKNKVLVILKYSNSCHRSSYVSCAQCVHLSWF